MMPHLMSALTQMESLSREDSLNLQASKQLLLYFMFESKFSFSTNAEIICQ